MNLLDKIDVTTESVAMEIKDLHGNPLTEVEEQKPRISIYGIDSDVFRNAERYDADDKFGNHKLIASCVDSWENIQDENGQPIACNAENALVLLKKYPVILKQADDFLTTRANYLKKF